MSAESVASSIEGEVERAGDAVSPFEAVVIAALESTLTARLSPAWQAAKTTVTKTITADECRNVLASSLKAPFLSPRSEWNPHERGVRQPFDPQLVTGILDRLIRNAWISLDARLRLTIERNHRTR